MSNDFERDGDQLDPIQQENFVVNKVEILSPL